MKHRTHRTPTKAAPRHTSKALAAKAALSANRVRPLKRAANAHHPSAKPLSVVRHLRMNVLWTTTGVRKEDARPHKQHASQSTPRMKKAAIAATGASCPLALSCAWPCHAL
eukprot:6179909-Pleurochrysis_carterae.AAC.3